MSTETGVQWCHHTFNPWWGCSPIHTGCANCYAESWDRRWGGGHWGKDAPRRMILGEWSKPAQWNRAAQAAGERRRVFVASMCDIMEDYPADRPVLDQQGKPVPVPNKMAERYAHVGGFNGFWNVPMLRRRTLDLVRECPWLDFLLLTKRPENFVEFTPADWAFDPPKNVMLGTSPANQETADRCIPALLKAARSLGLPTFLSCEPLLGPIDLRPWFDANLDLAVKDIIDTLKTGRPTASAISVDSPIHWAIVGGESGPGAREMKPEWAGSIVGQCEAAGVPVFFKQWGNVTAREMGLKDSKGGDPAEWRHPFPRQFPEVALGRP